jgi:hypothetical protein
VLEIADNFKMGVTMYSMSLLKLIFLKRKEITREHKNRRACDKSSLLINVSVVSLQPTSEQVINENV